MLDRLKAYLPKEEERGRYTGFLSTFAEYHGIGVGFVVYLTSPHLLALIVAYGALGSGARVKLTGQYKDAAKEPAYTALGVVLAGIWKNGGTIIDTLSALL